MKHSIKIYFKKTSLWGKLFCNSSFLLAVNERLGKEILGEQMIKAYSLTPQIIFQQMYKKIKHAVLFPTLVFSFSAWAWNNCIYMAFGHKKQTKNTKKETQIYKHLVWTDFMRSCFRLFYLHKALLKKE